MKLYKFLGLALLLPSLLHAAIITTPLPFILQNGQTADATQVMADFNAIVNGVNANAAVAANTALLNVTNTFTQPQVIPNGVALNQALNITQFDQNGTKFVTDTGAANAYVVAPTPAWTSYVGGSDLYVKIGAGNTSTAASTINVNALGAKNILNQDASTPEANALLTGQTYHLIYDGTQFLIIGKNNTGPTAAFNTNTTQLASTAFAVAQSGTQGANVASTGTVNLDTATGDYVHITGVTTITAITLTQGRQRTVVFDGALTITSGASLILPSNTNIVTVAGDSATVRGEAAGVVRIITYTSSSSGGGSGSSMVLLSSKTASSSASLVFGTVDFDWTIYDEYEFHIINFFPASNAVNLNCEFSQDGGSTFKTGSYTSNYLNFNGGAVTSTTNSGNTALLLTPTTQSNTTATAGLNFVLRFPKPSATGVFKAVTTRDLYFLNSGGGFSSGLVTGTWIGDTNAVNGITFLQSSGNISSGTIRAYGIKKQ